MMAEYRFFRFISLTFCRACHRANEGPRLLRAVVLWWRLKGACGTNPSRQLRNQAIRRCQPAVVPSESSPADTMPDHQPRRPVERRDEARDATRQDDETCRQNRVWSPAHRVV